MNTKTINRKPSPQRICRDLLKIENQNRPREAREKLFTAKVLDAYGTKVMEWRLVDSRNLVVAFWRVANEMLAEFISSAAKDLKSNRNHF